MVIVLNFDINLLRHFNEKHLSCVSQFKTWRTDRRTPVDNRDHILSSSREQRGLGRLKLTQR